MKIIVDQKIYLPEASLCSKFNLVRLPAEKISRDQLTAADGLLVRSVTHVDADLLEGTPVRFVASATAGTDHLDMKYLDHSNITWAHAPGANAQTVANYVAACVTSLQNENLLTKQPLRAGVIGVGQVGRRVVTILKNLGFDVLENDPPRAIKERPSHNEIQSHNKTLPQSKASSHGLTAGSRKKSYFTSTPLSEFKNLDLICIHTPLTFDGEFPTHQLINSKFLSQQKPGCVLLNAGRGAVIDSQALKQATHIIKVLDVWENEPNIDLELLKLSKIATPHIAGYSQAAKSQAAIMIYNALCEFYGTPTESITTENNTFFIDDIKAISNNFKNSKNFKTCRQAFENTYCTF